MARKIFFTTALLMIAATFCFAGAMVGVEWGMDRSEVKSAIPDVKWKGRRGGYIYYNDKLLEMDVMRIFRFGEDGLNKIEVSLTPTAGKLDIFEKFLELHKQMLDELGRPNESGCSNNAHFVDAREAIIQGRAECHVLWDIDDTRVLLRIERNRNSLTGDLEFWKPLVTYLPLAAAPAGNKTEADKT